MISSDELILPSQRQSKGIKDEVMFTVMTAEEIAGIWRQYGLSYGRISLELVKVSLFDHPSE